MNRATPAMRNFAGRLIAFEARRNESSTTKAQAPFQVCEILRPHLTILMGNAGFHALFLRALALARAQVPWLRTVHEKADGSLEGLAEAEAKLDPPEISEGGIVLVAQLLGLLVAFIGEKLTLRLVSEVWPKVPLDDLDFGSGDKNEKRK